MIAVFRDEEGLREAADELFEEAFEAPLLERNAPAADDCGDSGFAARDTRRLSPGYYMWLEFVLETLEQPMEAGLAIAESSISAEELTSLRILRNARQEFRRKHPPCRGCGAALRNEWDKICNDCQRANAAAERGRR